MSANFGLFILAFNEMALILLRTPIIFLQANQFVDMFNILIGDGCGTSSTPWLTQDGWASGVESNADFLYRA